MASENLRKKQKTEKNPPVTECNMAGSLDYSAKAQ